MSMGIHTRFEIRDAGTALENGAGGFVAEDAVAFHHESAYPACLPEMDIRAVPLHIQSR